ncbi:MAG TPA: hypothetical protein VIF57_10580 [Polyangia bacterium]|jgi:hypothetical protein
MRRRAVRLVVAVVAAGLLHAAAGRELAALDPIAALLGHRDAPVAVAAAIGLAVARLFLYVVAPAWAAHLTARCVARAIARARTAR